MASNPRQRPLERYQIVDLLTGWSTWTDASIAERREAVRILSERGLSAWEVADQLGACERTIVRARTALRVGTITTPRRGLKLPYLLDRCIPHHLREEPA
jgi:uncharacterized membrane protein